MRQTCLVCEGDLSPAPRLPGLLACPECGFVTAGLDLPPEELRALYSGNYFQGDEYADYLADRPTIEKHFRIRISQLLQYLPRERRGRLFEIGCAYGFFLSVAQPWFRDVRGVDISEDAVRWGQENLGVNAVAADFVGVPVDEPVDAVCMWDTIEHLAHPDEYIRKTAEILRPGGVLAVTTGDIESFVARVRGRRWRQIHPPTHLHYFSRRSLSRLLARHGFTVRYAGSDGMYRRLNMIAYILLYQKKRAPWLYKALARTGILNHDVYLNLHDILFIIAEKTGKTSA